MDAAGTDFHIFFSRRKKAMMCDVCLWGPVCPILPQTNESIAIRGTTNLSPMM